MSTGKCLNSNNHHKTETGRMHHSSSSLQALAHRGGLLFAKLTQCQANGHREEGERKEKRRLQCDGAKTKTKQPWQKKKMKNERIGFVRMATVERM